MTRTILGGTLLGATMLFAWASACSSNTHNGPGNTGSANSNGATAGVGGGTASNGTGTSTGGMTTSSGTGTATGTTTSSSVATSGTGGSNPTCGKFVKPVSNSKDPTQTGSGIPSNWSYNGMLGYAAGQAMCQAVGADHACTYLEIQKADAAGELANLPAGMTFWLHRTSNVMDTLQPNTTCKVDADCNGFNMDSASICDPAHALCAFLPGSGGRCDDWTYATNHINNGEWFEQKTDQGGVTCSTPFCDKPGGSLYYHFDRKTVKVDVAPPAGCKTDTAIGCSGPCSGGTNTMRSILCCAAPCMNQ